MAVAANFTKLSDLVKKFLKSIDSWNENDTTLSDTDTDQDTAGERARICLNLALSTIYGLLKDSKYLEAHPTQNLSSTANQAFIQLDIVPDIDDVESVTDLTNEFRLERRSWSWYRTNYPDPSADTGTPERYIIRNDRMYLAPTPSSSITYLTDFKKLTGDLKLPGDFPLIPTQYDGWIVAEAKVRWYEMEDPNSVPSLIITERDGIRQISIDSIMTGYAMNRQAASHFDRNDAPRTLGYQRPVGG